MPDVSASSPTFRIRVCPACRVRRRFRPRGAWQACDGEGHSRFIVCDWCQALDLERRPCSHEPGTPDCDVASQ